MSATTHARPPWRRALVVGLGKSGRAAAELLASLGVEVHAYDRKRAAGLPDSVRAFEGEAVPAKAFAGIDLLVLSPGVPPQPIHALAREHAAHAEVHGELGLALHLIASHADPAWPQVRTTLITGTNGKSTVTAMMGALLEAGGRRPFLGGNLGAPLCELLTKTRQGDCPWPDDLVLECSSYQLETLPRVRTDVAMLLNITPDHLDRYESLAHYAQTKARVFAGLGPRDLALLSADDPWTPRLEPRRATVTKVGLPGGPRIEGDGAGTTLCVAPGASIPREALRLPGRHNAVNALFAVTAGRHLGLSLQDCERGLSQFEGLPHRMAKVRELDGVVYYNDSKATNVASALASLGGLDRDFVLIAGGKAKGDDLAPLARLLATRARGLVTIGESSADFLAAARGLVPAISAADLAEAVTLARAMARPGHAVVLAPACASFDQFDSFAHRGRVFTEAVLALA